MEAATKREAGTTKPSAKLGRYRLLESLGQGGMADVMVAVMPGLAGFNKLLVVKTIREDIQRLDPQYATMFLDEARLAALLNHQNVVQTYEVGEHEGHYYIAMEYLEGQSLRHVQQKLTCQGLPLEARLRILIDVAHGLHHAHELTDLTGNPLHVVHRDVSPQNVFLTYDGQVKLLDFGIAKTRDAEVVTTVGHIKGKIDYMAPEQVKGEPLDRRADVFALGAIMWELLAGKPLSGGGKVSQITRVHNRVSAKECPISTVVPDVDAELARICDKALAHNVDDRYATAQDFARDLQIYLGERSLVPTSQQLAQLLRPAFTEERNELRQRLEKALAAIDHDDPSFEPGSQSYIGPTAPPPGRMRAAQAKAHTADGHAEPARKRFARPAQIATFVGAVAIAAWLAASPEQGANASAASRGRAEAAARGVDTAQAPRPAQAPREREVAAAEGTIRLRISTAVPDASVTLDGAALPKLPFEARLARDNVIHQLVATAPGREKVTQVLMFDEDKVVTLELPEVQARTVTARPARASRARARERSARASGSSDMPEAGEDLRYEPGAHEDVDDRDPYR